MSNHLISAVYKRDLRTPMRKGVMALLADKASDDGSGIYASKQTMADELCCSKQAVLDTIKGLLAEGLLAEIGIRKAPNGHTVEYGIMVDALDALPLVKCHADREARQRDRSTSPTGQRAGPVKKADRSTSLTPPVKHVDPNPPEPVSPKTSSSTKPRVARAVAFLPPSDIPEVEWEEFEEMRRQIKKPLTDGARRAAVDRLRKLAEDGHPPGVVLKHSTLNCYQGLFPPKDDGNAEVRRNRGSATRPADGFNNALHEAAGYRSPGDAR